MVGKRVNRVARRVFPKAFAQIEQNTQQDIQNTKKGIEVALA